MKSQADDSYEMSKLIYMQTIHMKSQDILSEK